MIDVFLVFDDLNPRGGSFVTDCLNDILIFFYNKPHRLNVLRSHDITANTIHNSTSNLSSFIFVPYCHGNEVCLANINSEVFISTTENNTIFSNSLFYTFSCSSGHTLGQNLIDNKCQCFFGYKKTIFSYLGYKQFLDCANHGLYLFVNGESTNNIYIQMKNYYNDRIDELYLIDPFAASYLRSNRDALVKIGNDISINDLIQ